MDEQSTPPVRTKYQEAIRTLEESHFVRLPSDWNVYPDPGQYITKVTPERLGVLVGLADRFVGYVFDLDGESLERFEVEREKSAEEENIPEAQVEIFPDSEVRETGPEEGQELVDEG
jgi:hypothetical protein